MRYETVPLVFMNGVNGFVQHHLSVGVEIVTN